METREEAWREGFRRGRAGYQFQAPLAPARTSDALVSLDFPEWAATGIVITAQQWTYNGSPAGANGIDNVTNAPALAPTGYPLQVYTGATYTPASVILRLEYGVSGAREIIAMDYPIGGLMFAVHAASVRLYVDNMNFTPAAGQPILGAYAALGVQVPSDLLFPRLTYTMVTSILFGTSALQPVPPRARAYRFYSTDQFGIANLFWTSATVQQEAQGGTVLQVDQDMRVAAAANSYAIESNRAEWYPLDPRATFVRISNKAGSGSLNGGLQFLIGAG